MSAPQRLQRSRKKGARLPPGTVCVTRGTKWGNPYRVSDYKLEDGSPMPVIEAVEMAVRDYEMALWTSRLSYGYADVRLELRGKNLACYCALGRPCHADTLIEIANSEPGKLLEERLELLVEYADNKIPTVRDRDTPEKTARGALPGGSQRTESGAVVTRDRAKPPDVGPLGT